MKLKVFSEACSVLGYWLNYHRHPQRMDRLVPSNEAPVGKQATDGPSSDDQEKKPRQVAVHSISVLEKHPITAPQRNRL